MPISVLLLGVGMQGRAALHDLVHSPGVSHVVAADLDLPAIEAEVARRGYGDKVACRAVNVADASDLDRLMAEGVDVVISLVPTPYIDGVAQAAVRNRVHMLNTSYATPGLRALAGDAMAAGVTLLPEFGLDPGLDLVLLGDMVRGFDSVSDIASYGSGLPEASAAGNPIAYKVSWSFEGVLRSYRRGARLIRDGRPVIVGKTEQFHPENVHTVDVAGVGRLEAYPNGDAFDHIERLGLDPASLGRAGRYTLRYPGHSAFWRIVVELGLLDDAPVWVDGAAVDRRRYLAAALEPRLRYGPGERDLALIRIEVSGARGGRRLRRVRQILDYRDLDTGFSAMSRLVGFTASAGARMIGAGSIGKRGLLSPLLDVPVAELSQELAARGIRVEQWESDEAG